jgi:hypothetical protein
MSFNTILVPIEQHDLMNATLETALVLGRKFNSYIEGFALRPVVAPVMAMDIGGAFPLAELQENDTKMATEAKALFDAFMHKNGVTPGDPKGGVGCGWLDGAPDGDQFVGSYGRVFDVTVLGRPGESAQSPRLSTYEACLFESGRPILLAPPNPPATMGENVLIAWNHSTEQARTNAFALPLLRGAKKVTILKSLLGWHAARWLGVFRAMSPWARFCDMPWPERLSFVAFVIALATTLTWFGGWLVFLLLWVLPIFTTSLFLHQFRTLAEHLATANTHELDSSRTVVSSPIERFFIAPFGLNFHLEHHLFPGVPAYHLGRVHRLLVANQEYRSRAHLTASYLGRGGLLREIICTR